VATGTGSTGTVYQSPRPATGSWSHFDDGLPTGIPITGIGIAPNRALCVASEGRGIWWRRDVSAVPPNSGVNAPDSGSSHRGEWFTIITTCSDPHDWHHIATLDFTLAMGHGAEEGNRVALRLEYDESRNVVRLYDAAKGVWQEGVPGSSAVLHTRYGQIRLDQTTVTGVGTDVPKPTVQIAWRIQLKRHSSRALQQWLRVTDDDGNATTWDKVGTWSFSHRRE